jgi:uncharacterized protein YbjT (DUF2867 family)
MAKGSERILVIGAAGRFAGLVVPQLAQRGVSVCGFVRNPDKFDIVRKRGASEVLVGDLRDEASVASAMKAINGVYYIAPVYPGDESQKIGIGLVNAAKNAGVKRFVFSSVIHPIISAMDNHIQKMPVEEAILQSGMDFTILQPSRFFQNFSAFWPKVLASGVFAEPFSPQSRLAYVDYRDVAEVAAIALTEDRLRNGTFQLCSEGGLDRNDIAAAMSDVLARPITAGTMSNDELQANFPPAVPAYNRAALVTMYDYYDRHGLVGNPLILNAILDREPRRIRDFLKDLVAGLPTVARP